jgi:hypothetical protein
VSASHVDRLEYPSWLGQPLDDDPGSDKISKGAGWGAAGTDAAQLGGLPIPGLDPAGGALTGVSQYRESTAQTTAGKLTDAVVAGALDIALGAVSPVIPVADFVVGKVADKAGANIGSPIADTANGLLRGGVTVVESALTGDKKGVAEFTAKAETGEYGRVVGFITSLFTGRKG